MDQTPVPPAPAAPPPPVAPPPAMPSSPMNFLRGKKLLVLGVVAVLMIGLFGTLFLLSSQSDDRSHASTAASLSFAPVSTVDSPLQGYYGKPMNFDVMLNPGTNLVNQADLVIQYDSNKFVNSVADHAFVPNPDIFGHVYGFSFDRFEPGRISVRLTVNDPAKIIQEPVKLGTLTLIPKAFTTRALTIISFGGRSAIYAATGDNFFNHTTTTHNVLSSTSPAYVSVNSTTAPTATSTPTTNPSPSISQAPSPTATLTPTPDTNANGTQFRIDALLHGLGAAGDNVSSESASSNKNPKHPARHFLLTIMSLSNEVIATTAGTLNYDATTGMFSGIGTLATHLSPGIYTSRLRVDNYLTRQVPGAIQITTTQTVTLPVTELITGDIDNNDSLDIFDYNILSNAFNACMTNPSDPACTGASTSDLNDDGTVDLIDYTLFIRELSTRRGQ